MILNFINKIIFDNNYNKDKNIYNEKNEVDLIIKELYDICDKYDFNSFDSLCSIQ